MDVKSSEQRQQLEVHGVIGQADLFKRHLPAAMELPDEARRAAIMVIDYGTYLLTEYNQLREDHRIRDAVMASLLRRALLTTESIRVLIEAGIEETAFALYRSLLDIRLNQVLVASDERDTMARRLAAYHYLSGKRRATDMLSHPDTRSLLQGGADGFQTMTESARHFKEFYASEVFNEVRESLKESRHWHGEESVERAFERAEMSEEYVQSYKLANPFVHASNVDHDFGDIIDGQPRLKALPQRDPQRLVPLLAQALMMATQVFETFLQDKGVADLPDLPEEVDSGTDRLRLDGLSLVRAHLIEAFQPWAERLGE